MAKIPFDIKYRSQIESGEYKVETRDGRPVRIICWDKKEYEGQRESPTPIVYLLLSKGGCEHIMSCTLSGLYSDCLERDSDLFIITPEPELSEFEERIFKLLRQYKECDIPLTPENIKAEASMLWPDLEKYFFDLYGKEGEGDSALRSFYYRGLEDGRAKALRTHAIELTKNLANSGMDKDSIPYHLIEFMCNLYTCPNWKEIEETAEAYVTRIKAAALNNLPRWRKCGKETLRTYGDEHFEYRDGVAYIVTKKHEILLSDLEKLPGFNE